MKKTIILSLIASVVLAISGCKSAGEHRADVRNDASDKITVGTVQQKIKNGMSSAEVIEALGSPNIISTDANNLEVWVYDKISTERAYSGSSGGVGGLGGVGRGSFGAGLLGNYGESTGASSSSQRTLTIVIKFDANKKVRDLSYRTSSF